MPKAPDFVWCEVEMRFEDHHSGSAEGERRPKGYLCWYGGEKGSWSYCPEWHGREMMVLGCLFGYRHFGDAPICCRRL